MGAIIRGPSPIGNNLACFSNCYYLFKKELDTSSSRYQLPISPNQVKSLVEYEQEDLSPNVSGRGRGNRGRGGGRGNSYGVEDHGEYESWDVRRGYAGKGNGRGYRGRGRGRRRGYSGENDGGRGRGYGGENSGYSRTEMHQESGEFEAPPPRGRGQRRGMASDSGRGQSYMSNSSEPAQANA